MAGPDPFTKERLKDLLRPEGYDDFGQGERHGSYEATWFRKDEGADLTRFIAVAITLAPLESPSQSSPQYRAEVWMGADSGERYARYLVAHVDGVDLTEEKVKEQLGPAVEEAKVRAKALQLGDLTNIHITTQATAKPTLIKSVGEPPSSGGTGAPAAEHQW